MMNSGVKFDASAWRAIESAHAAGADVTGTISAVVNGGFRVAIGVFDSFLPNTCLSPRRIHDPASYIGRTLPFRVLKLYASRRSIVVSRLPFLEAESKAKFAALIVGTVHAGVVKKLFDYGALVDIGGPAGLLHRSEIGEDSTLAKGTSVRVRILSIDHDNEKVSFALAQPLPKGEEITQ
ncbi:S1 RNA-binding domain-containing protein [Paraburkholderia sp. EG287A]|uniref:S1 RNA-binding domain-containing protein n=1 Tax=Paraburkholderia sp. EG287A TaxID=3237012 RepID=UPI0034D355C6